MKNPNSIRKHYTMFGIALLYQMQTAPEAEPVVLTQKFNVLMLSEDKNVTRSMLGQAQQGALNKLTAQVNADNSQTTVTVINAYVECVNYFGFMTVKEFNKGFEDIMKPENVPGSEVFQ